MSIPSDFRFIRPVDLAALAAIPEDERCSQPVLAPESGFDNCAVNFIRTPPGGGSPDGLHTHAFDQLFYILKGTMAIEVRGTQFDAVPGDLVVFPQGVPHKNWNASDSETHHLAFNLPAPLPGVPMSIPVKQ